MPKPRDPLAKAKRIMAEMLKLPPKQHSEMKVGKKRKAKTAKPSTRKKKAR